MKCPNSLKVTEVPQGWRSNTHLFHNQEIQQQCIHKNHVPG